MYVSFYGYHITFNPILKPEGGEKTKFKNGIIIITLLFICLTIHSATVEPVTAATIEVQNASYYSSGGSLNDQIQAILNNATSGDTIEFLGDIYQNLHLTITKQLNIITYVGTELIGSGTGAAVFTINGSQASRTTINGFNITGSGIIINNTSNVTISNTNISSAKGSAVNITKSTNTTIKNGVISNSNTGISVTNSKNTKITNENIKNNKKDGITLTNSVNTTINKSQITNNNENGINIVNSNSTTINNTNLKNNGRSTNGSAVYISRSTKVNIARSVVQNNSNGISIIDSSNIKVNNSTVVDNDYDGILVSGLSQNVTISYTDLERNYNGINLDSSSKKGNIHISSNKITDNGHDNEGNGIYLGPHYAQSKTDYIGHNAIYNNIGWDVNGQDTPGNVQFASNFFGSNPKRCCAMDYAADLVPVVFRIGPNTYVGAFYDPVTKSIVWDFPDGVPLSLGSNLNDLLHGKGISGTTKNSVFSATIPLNEIMGTIYAVSEGVVGSTSWDTEIDEALAKALGYDSGDGSGDGDGNTAGGGSGTDPGTGTNGQGGGTGNGGSSGSSTSSGASSGTSASTGLTSAVANAGSAGSPSGQAGSNNAKPQPETPKTAQELFIDQTVKNPQFWSIIGIIALLLIIFGAYYRKDLTKMIKKSKK